MMRKCPICAEVLQHTLLENNLVADQCPEQHGVWLSANDYLTWLSSHASTTVVEMEVGQAFERPYPTSDNQKALFCADCGRFLRRYQIWPNIDFHLDRCSHCNGIWFDENEWHTLQAQDLHRLIHLFFTKNWQDNLRTQEMRVRFEKMYAERFGEADYAEIKRVRNWLATHPQGNVLLAYLTDKDPYKG